MSDTEYLQEWRLQMFILAARAALQIIREHPLVTDVNTGLDREWTQTEKKTFVRDFVSVAIK